MMLLLIIVPIVIGTTSGNVVFYVTNLSPDMLGWFG